VRRKDIEKRLRAIAKSKGVEVTFDEGGNHTIVRFDGTKVSVLPRHSEVNEFTARAVLRDAEQWEKEQS
jgi:hypothetical protein